MSLAPSVLLAPYFTAHELGADTPGIPATAESNLFKTAAWLSTARALLGVPLIISPQGGYRAVSSGSTTSDHPNGLAADFRPRGMWSWPTAYDKIKAVQDQLPPWDQLIFYPVTGHVHVGLGSRMRREVRIALAEGGYPLITPELETKLRGSLPVLFVVLIIGVLLLVVVRYA
jgi:hypothetical protein